MWHLHIRQHLNQTHLPLRSAASAGSHPELRKEPMRFSFIPVVAAAMGLAAALPIVDSTSITLSGYIGTYLNNATISAPLDVYGGSTLLGSEVFKTSNASLNVQLCADACHAKSAYALAHPPKDGAPVPVCLCTIAIVCFQLLIAITDLQILQYLPPCLEHQRQRPEPRLCNVLAVMARLVR